MNKNIQPMFRMLTREDCLRIHQASLRILHQTGVQIFNQAAIELLEHAGAAVSGKLVKIPPSLVERGLSTVPSVFSLFERGSDKPVLTLNGQNTFFGPGSDTLHYLDPRTGTRRDYQIADLADCYRLVDALRSLDFVMSIGIPRDVPNEFYYRHQFATMLRNTIKPIVFVCEGHADMEAIYKMAVVVAGDAEKLKVSPNLLLYSEPSSPLQHSKDATDKLLFCADHAIPITHSPAPMMGGTAPITIAGAVALGNAETLSSIVIHQIRNPGAPFLYGHGVHHLDMKTMVSVYGAPEFQLARVLAAEMGHFYDLPVWGYAGHTDSKVVDGQAAADVQFSVLIALLAKTNLNHDVGYIESGLSCSPDLMTFTDEVISMNRKMVEGIQLDDKSLALEVIDEVGPGGNFLDHDHTLSNWKDLWMPQLFDRQRMDRWADSGRKDINAILKEKTLELIETHTVEPLPEAAEEVIRKLLTH